MTTATYRGRFAPSPTGPLHAGSLAVAVAGFLDARANGGAWLLRIEDIDPPREQPGAADAIIDCLRCHGLHWNEDILWQSERHSAYRAALETLRAAGQVFPCCCTRARLGPGGSCGERCRPTASEPVAWRLRLPAALPATDDRFLGRRSHPESRQDVILWRKDGLPAYQLAVTVDDGWQGISEVVRGADLLDETPLQCYLLELLGHCLPRYAHVPLVTDGGGQKLSKQAGATALDVAQPLANLRCALRHLRQPSAEAAAGDVQTLLRAAVEDWQPARLADTRHPT